MSPPLPSWLARIRGAPVTVALIVIDVAVFLFAELHGRTTDVATLVRFGAVETSLVWAGQYWRLATYMFLHIGWLHLLWNAHASFGWCTQVEQRLGHWRFLVVYLLGGIAGGAASTVLPYPVSAGASGAMFGMVGATLAIRRRALPSFAAAWADRSTRATLANIAIWTVVGVTVMPMNNRAHLGGLLAGALAAWIFTAERPRPLWIAYGTAFAALLLLATRPGSAHVAPPEDAALDHATLARCDQGDHAACHAFVITLPASDGETTGVLSSMCDVGDLDACAAWGWVLANGRPGVPRDEPRGKALLESACSRGSAWGCGMAKGASPIAALDAGPSPAVDAGGGARCETARAHAAETTSAFFARVVDALAKGASVRTRMGSFELVEYRAYEGRDPRTGAVVPVPAKRIPFFVASEELAQRARGRHAPPPAGRKDRTLPGVDVACNDAELDAVARALADCPSVEVPELGTLSARGGAGEDGDFELAPSVAAVDALNAR